MTNNPDKLVKFIRLPFISLAPKVKIWIKSLIENKYLKYELVKPYLVGLTNPPTVLTYYQIRKERDHSDYLWFPVSDGFLFEHQVHEYFEPSVELLRQKSSENRRAR